MAESSTIQIQTISDIDYQDPSVKLRGVSVSGQVTMTIFKRVLSLENGKTPRAEAIFQYTDASGNVLDDKLNNKFDTDELGMDAQTLSISVNSLVSEHTDIVTTFDEEVGLFAMSKFAEDFGTTVENLTVV